MGRLGLGRADGARAGRARSNGIAWFHVESEHSGYVVVIRSGGTNATALTRAVAAQSSAPDPGPTLAVRVKGGAVTARVAPARTAEEARAIAARLV